MTKKIILFWVLILICMSAISQSVRVKIETTKGTMVVMLYDKTPLHRDNFVKLVNSGFYDGLLFHRVIGDFMIQGGDPQSRGARAGQQLGAGGPGYTIPAEFVTEYYHKKGALAAARQGDNVNPKRESSGSQFYIVQGKKYTDMQLDSMEKQLGFQFSKQQRDTYVLTGGTPFLDRQYTVFGEIVEGMNVVDNIAAVEKNHSDRPINESLSRK